MDDKMQKVRTVKRAHEKTWLAMSGVVAVGIGLTQSGEPGIIISTSVAPEKLRPAIPDSIDGVPVELNQTGEISAF